MPSNTRKHAKRKSSARNNSRRKFGIKNSTTEYSRSGLSKQILGILFVILGLFFLYKLPVVNIDKSHYKKEPIVASSKFDKKNGEPTIVRILLPNENIDLPVTPSKIIGGFWQTSDTTASWGEGTANPGTGGNIVVFAHARLGLFYNLKDVKKNDVVYIFTKDKWYRYKVSEITKVYPNQIETIAPTKKEVLTLFTCSGFYDEKRLIVKAYPAGD